MASLKQSRKAVRVWGNFWDQNRCKLYIVRARVRKKKHDSSSWIRLADHKECRCTYRWVIRLKAIARERARSHLATRKVVYLGTIPLTVYKLGDSQYMLAQSNITDAIQKHRQSMSDFFLMSKSLDALPCKGWSMSGKSSISTLGKGNDIKPVQSHRRAQPALTRHLILLSLCYIQCYPLLQEARLLYAVIRDNFVVRSH